MGFFGKKKDTEDTKPARAVKAPSLSIELVAIASVIKKPRITEKSALLSEKNVYTFEVQKGATKFEICDAIKKLYNVTPERVCVVNRSPRHFTSRSRGRDMMEHGLRKAYVYLKKGDRIELV